MNLRALAQFCYDAVALFDGAVLPPYQSLPESSIQAYESHIKDLLLGHRIADPNIHDALRQGIVAALKPFTSIPEVM